MKILIARLSAIQINRRAVLNLPSVTGMPSTDAGCVWRMTQPLRCQLESVYTELMHLFRSLSDHRSPLNASEATKKNRKKNCKRSLLSDSYQEVLTEEFLLRSSYWELSEEVNSLWIEETSREQPLVCFTPYDHQWFWLSDSQGTPRCKVCA